MVLADGSGWNYPAWRVAQHLLKGQAGQSQGAECRQAAVHRGPFPSVGHSFPFLFP